MFANATPYTICHYSYVVRPHIRLQMLLIFFCYFNFIYQGTSSILRYIKGPSSAAPLAIPDSSSVPEDPSLGDVFVKPIHEEQCQPSTSEKEENNAHSTSAISVKQSRANEEKRISKKLSEVKVSCSFLLSGCHQTDFLLIMFLSCWWMKNWRCCFPFVAICLFMGNKVAHQLFNIQVGRWHNIPKVSAWHCLLYQKWLNQGLFFPSQLYFLFLQYVASHGYHLVLVLALFNEISTVLCCSLKKSFWVWHVLNLFTSFLLSHFFSVGSIPLSN